MDRFEIAWRIWCWQQGYGKAEDRVGLINWMRDDQVILHPDDLRDRDDCLAIADEVVALVRNEVDTVFCKNCRPLLEGTRPGLVLGYKIGIGDKIYDPEDVTIIREVTDEKKAAKKEYTPPVWTW